VGFFGRTPGALKLVFVVPDAAVATGVEEGARLLASGHRVVVVDGPEALVRLLHDRRPDAPGRLAVVVGDPTDPEAMEAARELARRLFPPER
jgi:NAD(P)-dependent dehydrogenase (short-subunit alcohol dehydrogenase family)